MTSKKIRVPLNPRYPRASDGTTSPEGPSRLGTVMRFAPEGGGTGIRQLVSSGFKVASTSDFREAPSVPNDFGGADVQYFERFGIAIVRRDGQRLRPALQKAMEQKVVRAARPERLYRALGAASAPSQSIRPLVGYPAERLPDMDYLHGYRDGVNHLLDRLLDSRPLENGHTVAQFQEAATTWGLEAARIPLAGLSGAGIKVAVLDTGFDDTHPDFRGRTVVKKLFASNSVPDDTHGHGTHCIGTACGPLRPAKGPRYGIAYEAEIYAGKVLGDDGFGTDRSIIAGMEWAVEQGCQVISMSLGAETAIGDLPNDDYEQIGQVCLDSGSLVVAAAGNESRRPGRISPVGSPANASTIMAVAAIDRSFGIAEFSCGGMNANQEVDIAAPGVDILSSLPGGEYDRWDGTSMATPHVAGVAALLAESSPKYRGWALWARLLQLVRPLPLLPRDVGKGFLQAPSK